MPLATREPPDARACYALAQIAAQDGQLEHATAFYGRAASSDPRWLEPIEGLVELLLLKNRFEEIDRLLGSVAPQHASNASYHLLVAHVLKRAGALQPARVALRRAQDCQTISGNELLAVAKQMREMGDFDLALNALERALNFSEVQYKALVNGGALLQLLGRPEAAVRWYARASALNESDPDLVIQYSTALYDAGAYEDWKRVTKDADGRLKQHQRIQLTVERAQFDGDFETIRSLFAQLNSASRTSCADADSEGLSYRGLFVDNPPAQRRLDYDAIDKAYSDLYIKGEPRQTSWPPTTVVNRQLRIGYLSADFRDHVLGRMMLPVLKNRDNAAQRPFLYSTGLQKDKFTTDFLENVGSFSYCAHDSDEVLARRIAADKIDILVDLSGPTAGSRPGVLARKPAPVIITHVGAAGPIGLSAVDYKLTDSICDLPENQEYLIEKLLPMAGCCYPVPKYPLPTQGLAKKDLRLENNVTLGAFFTYMKLSERCVRLWKQVLDAIPNAVILFSPLDPKLKVAYENIMRAVEIPPERFRFIPCGPTVAEQLARYRLVDMVIDSMPYGGVNGTLEALYMGVPVVTQLGTHHSERTSASMLTHLGVTDTIAQSPSEYVSIARKLAENPELRNDISTRIRARWPKFADPVDYARRWEAVLRKVAR